MFETEETEKFVPEIQIETDFEILFPNEYISLNTERLNLYKELANIENEAQLENFRKRLIDRFGTPP